MKDFFNRINWAWRRKALLIGVLDVICTCSVYFFALLLRFDFTYSNIYAQYMQEYRASMPIWCFTTILVFCVCRLYRSIWSHVSLTEIEMIMKAYIVLIPVYYLIVKATDMDMPRSYYIMGFIMSYGATNLIRVSYRMTRYFVRNADRNIRPKAERIMVIGAGSAGQMLIKELQNSDKLHSKVCCVIDDNPTKRGRLIEGVEIVGNRQDIVHMAQKFKITHIIFAIPSCSLQTRTAILNICKETNCKLQIIPGMYQLLNEEVSITRLRDVELTDLLGREQVKVNNAEILEDISGKVILVTGGGGSIGSELCRQIASATPKKLIILDIYENNAYQLQQELRRRYPDLDMVVLIGSVRNTNRIHDVMRTYRPDIVFHAAAHKHVPLMEVSPNEAIKNNVIGTYKTAQAAAKWGVGKFILISSDKAVNPTNIMGASKRLCEMVIQMMDRQCEATSFVAVRFGNVLGSNGSVIPLFRQQIAAGGPVTVTDKRVIRYFMTIPEAVMLVLQASYYARGGEIFVLEMGEPVKIDDMARNLIRLSGFTPDLDIKIEYTGLRPGEKLYEELLMNEEGLQDTENRLIHIGKPIEMDDAWFTRQLELLDEASRNESTEIQRIVQAIIPAYRYRDTTPV